MNSSKLNIRKLYILNIHININIRLKLLNVKEKNLRNIKKNIF